MANLASVEQPATMNSEDVPDPGAVPGDALTFWLRAESQEQLAIQLQGVLDEHLRPEHELHVAYTAMQVGWRNDPGFGQRFAGVHVGRAPHTVLEFEYSALVVLRYRGDPQV